MKRELFSGACGALAASLVLVGGQLAWGADQPAVNAQPVAPSSAGHGPVSFADVVARVAPAVVSIDVEGKSTPQATASQRGQSQPFEGLPAPFEDLQRLFPQLRGQVEPQPFRGAGSGFFISADGYIVTNNHVVERAEKVTVRTTDDRVLQARVIGRDPDTDLAVIKVDGRGFPFVSFEERAKPRVGDWVVAVGNPFNLGGTATAGIVSALSRPNVSGSSYVDYMQIDAPINRGNSGGPTFDLYGRVVGVNSAIFSPSGGSVGIGFDIPADVAARVARQLIADGKVIRGYIGATVQDVSGDVAESLGLPPRSGALVADVEALGPAARAGVRSGDIITEADGKAVRSATELTRLVAGARPGAGVTLTVRRDGRLRTLSVLTAERPSDPALVADSLDAQGDTGGLGFAVSPAPGGGLRIERLARGSDAAAKGLRPGDVIEAVGGRQASSAADLIAAVRSARAAGRGAILVQVARSGRRLFVPLNIPAAEG